MLITRFGSFWSSNNLIIPCAAMWMRIIRCITANKSSVIRQKGESQKGCFKKTKHAKFSENEHFFPSDKHTYVYVSGGKKCSFFIKFGVLCFLETPFLRFALSYYWRNVKMFVSRCKWYSGIRIVLSLSVFSKKKPR